MPGRMPNLEQSCIRILLMALRHGLEKDHKVKCGEETFIDDNVPTLTISADGKPIVQIVVIATDLTPDKKGQEVPKSEDQS